MTKHVLLNNVAHKNLKVDTRYSKEFSYCFNSVVIFPTEYIDAQRDYPILFQKNPDTGEYQSVALLGFSRDENLFLVEHEWKASYVPCIVARGPFLIGFQEVEVGGELLKEPVIHIDLDDPRVNEHEGESVFLEHGGNTPYLERVVKILKAVHEGVSIGKLMFAEFESLELIEPVDIEVEIHSEEMYKLTNFYTISTEKLAALNGEKLERLHRAGFLQGAFLIASSLNNLHRLIDMKQQRILNS